MKCADLTRVVDEYESFRPQKPLLTKMDETSCFGSILNEAVRTGKPASFLANGQGVPEDLLEATRDRVIDLVLGGKMTESAAPGSGDPQWMADPAWKQRAGSAAAA